MIRSARRVAGALLIALAAAVTLTGCDQLVAEPMVFTRVGDQVVVRTCLAMSISSVTIEEETTTTRTDADGRTATLYGSEVVWQSFDLLFVDPGDEFALGVDTTPSVIDQTPLELPLEFTGDNYAVAMQVKAADGNGSWEATSYLDMAGLTEGVWVDSRGDQVDPPCVHEKCMPGWACHNNWPIPTGDATRSDPSWTPTPAPEAPAAAG